MTPTFFTTGLFVGPCMVALCTHSRHRCMKCKNAGSSVRTAAESAREPGRRLRPFELVTVRGQPLESVENVHSYNNTTIIKLTTIANNARGNKCKPRDFKIKKRILNELGFKISERMLKMHLPAETYIITE